MAWGLCGLESARSDSKNGSLPAQTTRLCGAFFAAEATAYKDSRVAHTLSANGVGNLIEIPEVDGVAELDADLFAAFSVAEAVNDLCLGAGAFVFAAEDYRAAFIYWAAAQEGGAVAADAHRPGLFVPSLVRIFAAQPDRDGGNAARAAAYVLAKLRDAKKKIQQDGFGVRLGEAGICGEFFGLLGTVRDESFELVRGGRVERKIPEAVVARFQFRYACGEKVIEAQRAAVKVNRGDGVAGGAGTVAGLEEQVHVR